MVHWDRDPNPTRPRRRFAGARTSGRPAPRPPLAWWFVPLEPTGCSPGFRRSLPPEAGTATGQPKADGALATSGFIGLVLGGLLGLTGGPKSTQGRTIDSRGDWSKRRRCS